MNKEFVTYNQSLALKELGFDEPCFTYYKNDQLSDILELVKNSEMENVNNEVDNYISAPTFSQSFRFFREKYNLVHEISWSKSKSGVSFDYDIWSLVLPTDDELGDEDDVYIDRPMETYDSLAEKTFRDTEFNSYEEAELTCINKLIEICKKSINL